MHASYDFLIVGAGFSGAVIAERLARVSGKRSLVIDRRNHIAGNAFDCYDDAGVLIHPYGPHYFRTNSDRVREYLSQFTEWQPVTYRILSYTDGRLWNFPINLNTFEQFIGRPSTTEEMERTLAQWRVPIDQRKTLKRSSSPKSAISFTRSFLRIILANNGAGTPANSTPASAEEFRFAQIATTVI